MNFVIAAALEGMHDEALGRISHLWRLTRVNCKCNIIMNLHVDRYWCRSYALNKVGYKALITGTEALIAGPDADCGAWGPFRNLRFSMRDMGLSLQTLRLKDTLLYTYNFLLLSNTPTCRSKLSNSTTDKF